MRQNWFIIPLTKGKVAIVDLEGYRLVGHLKWSATKCHKKWYARGGDRLPSGRTKTRWMAPMILGTWISDVDHINGNTLDNRRENLRACEHWQNGCNQARNSRNRSGFRGVCWHSYNRIWVAQIRIDQKNVTIGNSHDILEAALIYDRAARRFHGEFAQTNFPDGSTIEDLHDVAICLFGIDWSSQIRNLVSAGQ